MSRREAILAVCVVACLTTIASAQKVCVIHVQGAIGPATASYIARAIDEAAAERAQCLIIQLDTPGGLLDSTKTIVQSLLAAPIPTVVYVAPSGASAASAGCFITLAADVAAMAPATNIGAAHPVGLGPGGEEGKDDTMRQKLENYTASYIETIAARRHRNVEWARSAVSQSASITAQQALDQHVIDLIAENLPDLLRQLDGRSIGSVVLKTAGAQVVLIPMSVRESIFQLIWRPEVVFLLMLIAIYGLIGELSNPGAILPGVGGAIALILVLYMAAVLPLNLAGLALIGLSLLLFVIDVFAPTHGVLTIGGVFCFFMGSIMLFDRIDPVFRLSLAIIVPATAVTAAFFLFIVGAGLRAQFLPVKAGIEAMLGQTVPALTRINGQGGKVLVEGEYWNAVSEVPVEPGTPVRIISADGLTLKVEPKSQLPHQPPSPSGSQG